MPTKVCPSSSRGITEAEPSSGLAGNLRPRWFVLSKVHVDHKSLPPEESETSMTAQNRALILIAANNLPANELSTAVRTLDQVREQLVTAGGESTDEHLAQALELTQSASARASEALQAAVQASEHARSYAMRL